MGFGQFVGNALFAPLGVLLPHGNDLLFDAGIGAVGLLGGRTGEVLQRGVAARLEARFPIIEGPATNMSGPTGQRDVASRLPGLEEEPALRGRRERKMDAFGHGAAS
jgi:hypothetical protein